VGEELVKETTDCFVDADDALVLDSEFKPYNKCNVEERMDNFTLVDTGTDISMEYTVLYMNTHYSVLDNICTVNQSEKCITVGGKVLIIEGVDGDTCTVNEGIETVILTTNGFDCVDGVKHIVIPDSVENILCSISTDLQKRFMQLNLNTTELEYSSIYLTHALFGVCQTWIAHGKKESPQEITDFLMKMLGDTN